MKISKAKYNHLMRLSTEENIISALAIDQRGSLKKMIGVGREVDNIQRLVESFKEGVSEILTPYSSSILLDPEYGLPAANLRDTGVGLLLAYEETGYDTTEVGRLPELLPYWTSKRIKESGADAVKFLLYFDVDESSEINDRKIAFIERIGYECLAVDIPFFLEIVTYDANIEDEKSLAYAKIKPRKVIEAMKIFSDTRFHVDVLKVEVPVNMNYVDGYSIDGSTAYTKKEAMQYFLEQSYATSLPFIYLSAGVSMDLFKKTLVLAKEAGANFNGVLCGRATWADAVKHYVQGGDKASREWLLTKGRENIQSLNAIVKNTAVPWNDKITV
ncbi:tagatose-bisphosphate aldolase [Aerococcaceae bacterium zg-BR9]|uniref:tagatose-bisphosphate aldolase n=1 Tax=Aerococcaceae bacterium zg-1292 TaxID=2774330 RepID=UPI004064C482|nr:tagatose-bisphosphate aldolase [Aerococcaceae bacterium zg-BR9]